MSNWKEYAKAITAAVVAALTCLATAVQNDGISAFEWLTAAIAFFVALGAVYRIPNSPPSTPGQEAAPEL